MLYQIAAHMKMSNTKKAIAPFGLNFSSVTVSLTTTLLSAAFVFVKSVNFSIVIFFEKHKKFSKTKLSSAKKKKYDLEKQKR
jgi:hypothetical protein